MPRYLSLSRADGTPADANRHKWVNDARLPEGAIYAHRDAKGLLDDNDLTMLSMRPDGLASWVIVEVEAGDDAVIKPRRDEALEGLFLKTHEEVARTPATDWLAGQRDGSDPSLAKAAGRMLMMADMLGKRTR